MIKINFNKNIKSIFKFKTQLEWSMSFMTFLLQMITINKNKPSKKNEKSKKNK